MNTNSHEWEVERFGLRRQSAAATALSSGRRTSIARDVCVRVKSGVALRFPPHSMTRPVTPRPQQIRTSFWTAVAKRSGDTAFARTEWPGCFGPAARAQKRRGTSLPAAVQDARGLSTAPARSTAHFGLRWQVGRDTAFAVHKIPACLAAADFALLSENQFL